MSLCRRVVVGMTAPEQVAALAPQFTPDAVKEIARLAEDINLMMDNIGARRLHTVLERIVDPISFDAPDKVGLPGGLGHSAAGWGKGGNVCLFCYPTPIAETQTSGLGW